MLAAPTGSGGMFNFDVYTIVLGTIFGVIGYAAWRYGRRELSTRHLLLGAALMGYSYFIPNPWIALCVGIVLTVLLFV